MAGMQMRILASFLALGTALMGATPVRLYPPGSATPEEIEQLHECIKLRFLDTRSFGMSRILPNRDRGIRVFHPENPAEQSVLSKLRLQGYEVGLYLAGRRILLERPAIDARRSTVQGPAFMTPFYKDELPPPELLLADSRRALINFEKGEGYDIQKPGWMVAMRPLRATNESCVQCHGSVKIGDPLGVALYVYRRSTTPSK
jgi:hypothetical protein